ncbi:phospholipid-transporting ATPase VB-like [Rana temporaria]|uniref:phospholipid-transporting ATPase VB-like n=1 Tax=Rana temporaria TaxID=8407 RepID=UPI001AACDCD6|nr:phospholipid-transporting ATPase VB-like [Rana temporaria]
MAWKRQSCHPELSPVKRPSFCQPAQSYPPASPELPASQPRVARQPAQSCPPASPELLPKRKVPHKSELHCTPWIQPDFGQIEDILEQNTCKKRSVLLLMDSSFYRWRQVLQKDSSTCPSERTPLLTSRKKTPTYNLNKQRVVFANNKKLENDRKRVSRFYTGNKIQTTKYTILTFLPKNLFEQFYRSANLYFLFLAILNWIPVIEVFHKEITMVPLVIVLLVIAVKDGVEDYKRYRNDRNVNLQRTTIYNK